MPIPCQGIYERLAVQWHTGAFRSVALDALARELGASNSRGPLLSELRMHAQQSRKRLLRAGQWLRGRGIGRARVIGDSEDGGTALTDCSSVAGREQAGPRDVEVRTEAGTVLLRADSAA